MDWLVMLLKIIVLPPLGLAVLAILGWTISGRWPRFGRTMVWGSLLLLYLLGTPFISSLLLGSLQWFPALATNQVNHPAANAIVILSADADSRAPEYGGSIAGPLTLERLEYGARLARDLQLPILLTGGKTREADVPLAVTMQESLLRDFNLKPRWIETKSRTTHENAILSASILKAEGVNTVYLVTHAWHMPRAKAAFEAAGVAVIPAPTRFVTAPILELEGLLPTPRGLQNSYLAFHEWIGLEWYSLAYR
jgi:uncharacterized SAM-binding protein YcdF (DUF218 family)